MAKYDTAPTVASGLLRLARHKASLTQRQLAQTAGVTQQAVSAYETGRMEPTIPTLQRLLAAAGLEMRITLEPLTDDGLDEWMAGLPDGTAERAAAMADTRAAQARLRRIRGK